MTKFHSLLIDLRWLGSFEQTEHTFWQLLEANKSSFSIDLHMTAEAHIFIRSKNSGLKVALDILTRLDFYYQYTISEMLVEEIKYNVPVLETDSFSEPNRIIVCGSRLDSDSVQFPNMILTDQFSESDVPDSLLLLIETKCKPPYACFHLNVCRPHWTTF